MKAERKTLKVSYSTKERFEMEKEKRMSEDATTDDFMNHLIDKLPPLKVKTDKVS